MTMRGYHHASAALPLVPAK